MGPFGHQSGHLVLFTILAFLSFPFELAKTTSNLRAAHLQQYEISFSAVVDLKAGLPPPALFALRSFLLIENYFIFPLHSVSGSA
jgi:hypothetical protein